MEFFLINRAMHFHFVVALLSTMVSAQSNDDKQFDVLFDLLENPNTDCSQFVNQSGVRSGPIFVHEKHPVLLTYTNDNTLSEYFNQTRFFVEAFIMFFQHYFPDISNTNSNNSFQIQKLLGGLLNFQKIQAVGLCLNGKLYHSSNYLNHDYLCKSNDALHRSSATDSQTSNFRFLKWEPVICRNYLNTIKYPIRLVYSIRWHQSEKPSIMFFEFNLMDFKLDQCAHKSHRCLDTTQCIYQLFDPKKLFVRGNYICRCKDGFYSQHTGISNFSGKDVEKTFRNKDKDNSYYSLFCLDCKKVCGRCGNESCIFSSESTILRVLPLATQSFCITMCIVTGIIIFQLRRTRVVKSSNWILLELFLLGAILIYCTIINSYFVPSEITCAIQPFLREGGFVLMYGVLYVKVYRVLCSFQSRKAQRVYVRDQDILRYLGVLVIICMGHLIAWLTTGFDNNLNNQNRFSYTKNLTRDSSNVISKVCRSRFWEIVSYVYETGLLALTIYYCKCVKSAPSEYGEVRFITIAVINELLISLLVIITRLSIVNTIHPDYIYLIHFLHCHATATISVMLVIGPKMWYLYRPPVTSSCKPRLVPHTESHIIQTQQKLNGDVDLVEINLAEMDCETIRDELKRLYTQLEIYKTRAMRKDNPHVSRKRGGRKQRRFSLQHFHKKHHTASVHDDETSKISEDSAGNSGGEEATLTSTSNK